MKQLLTFSALCLLLPSCTVGPFIKDSSGNVASLGGSIFSKSDEEQAYYEGPLGKLGYASKKKDETSVPKAAITGHTVLGLGGQALSATRAKESTRRVLSGHEVEKTGIKSAENVRVTEILNPVEEAPAAITPTITSP